MTKITFEAAAFAEAAKAIRDVPGSSRDIDILSHARFEVSGDELRLTMSDLDLEARVVLAAEGVPVLAAIPSAVLDFFAARADAKGEASVEFDADMRSVVARHGRARMEIQILRGEDFPIFPTNAPDWSFRLRAHELCRLLQTCRKATADDEARPFFCGVFLHVADGELVAVGCDGYRIHRSTGDQIAIEGDHPGSIVPDRAVERIMKTFGGDESEIIVSGTANRIVVEGEKIRIVSKLIAEKFMEYRGFFAETGTGRVSLKPKALDAAISRLTVIPKTEGKGKLAKVRAVRLTPGADELLIEIKGDLGNAEDRIEAKVEGPTRPVVLNTKFLRDILDAAGDGDVTLVPPDTPGKGLVRVIPRDEALSFGVMELSLF